MLTVLGLRMLRTKLPMARLLGKACPGQAIMRWRLHLLGLLLSSSHTHSSLNSRPQCFLCIFTSQGLLPKSLPVDRADLPSKGTSRMDGDAWPGEVVMR